MKHYVYKGWNNDGGNHNDNNMTSNWWIVEAWKQSHCLNHWIKHDGKHFTQTESYAALRPTDYKGRMKTEVTRKKGLPDYAHLKPAEMTANKRESAISLTLWVTYLRQKTEEMGQDIWQLTYSKTGAMQWLPR